MFIAINPYMNFILIEIVITPVSIKISSKKINKIIVWNF